MTDILEHIDVHVRCDQCGDYTVSAEVIAESQRLLAEGCPGSAYECPCQTFATLLEPSALESLKSAWRDLERSAHSPVRSVSVDFALHVDGNEKVHRQLHHPKEDA